MSFYTIYFSPTGGTKAVADHIAAGFGETPGQVDLCCREQDFAKYTFSQGDTCLIAVPSYGGRVPLVALERLQAITGGGAKAVLIVAYGNRAYDDTLLELQGCAVSCGFSIIGAVAAVTEHSIIRKFGAARPDGEDIAELVAFGQRLCTAAGNEKTPPPLVLPGDVVFRPYGGVPLKPSAGKKCTRCGLCAKKCPVGAIPKENPSRTNGDTCISCMGCIAVCPVKARGNSKLLLAVVEEKLKKVCAERKSNQIFIAE